MPPRLFLISTVLVSIVEFVQRDRLNASLDLYVLRLEPSRNTQRFAQGFSWFIDEEAWRIGRYLKEHTAGFLEVDRVKVSMVLYRCYTHISKDLVANRLERHHR